MHHVCHAVDRMGDTRVRFKCAKAVRLCAARWLHVRFGTKSIPSQRACASSVGKTPSFSFCQVDMYVSLKMLSNVLTAKAILRALLSSYLTRYIKNIYSVQCDGPLCYNFAMECRGVYNFVTELSHLLCNVFANYTFLHKNTN